MQGLWVGGGRCVLMNPRSLAARRVIYESEMLKFFSDSDMFFSWQVGGNGSKKCQDGPGMGSLSSGVTTEMY